LDDRPAATAAAGVALSERAVVPDNAGEEKMRGAWATRA
jgi:hypothetical protein